MSSSSGFFIPIVVIGGGVLAVVALVALAFWLRQRSRSETHYLDQVEQFQQPSSQPSPRSNPDTPPSGHPPGSAASLTVENATEPWQNEVARLLGSGRKIQAIKRYREQTGAGLREARDAVEALERQLAQGYKSSTER